MAKMSLPRRIGQRKEITTTLIKRELVCLAVGLPVLQDASLLQHRECLHKLRQGDNEWTIKTQAGFFYDA